MKTEVQRLDDSTVKDLHKQSIEDVSSYLTNLIRSKRNLIKFTYKVGESIELEFETTRLNYAE